MKLDSSGQITQIEIGDIVILSRDTALSRRSGGTNLTGKSGDVLLCIDTRPYNLDGYILYALLHAATLEIVQIAYKGKLTTSNWQDCFVHLASN